MAQDIAMASTASAMSQAQPSLRQLRSSPAWGERGADARRYLAPADRDRLPAALAEAQAWLAPPTKAEMIEGLSAALTLVAPSSMGKDERKLWLSSAAGALRDVPADVFRAAVDTARRHADHPSKIVPTIIGYADDIIKRRRLDLANVQQLVDADRRMPWEQQDEPVERVTPEQLAEIKAAFPIFASEPAARAARPPATVADYVAAGLTEAEAVKAVADHERMMARGAKPVSNAGPARAATKIKPPAEYIHGLIAMALARRYLARKLGPQPWRVGGANETIARFRAQAGLPTIAWLISATRAKLREMRADQAAA